MNKALCVGIAVLAIVLTSLALNAQVKKGTSRILLTEQLMEGVMQPNCKALGDGLKEAPSDDEAWKTLARHAALLNEVGYILMDDGRCPDADWANAAKMLREGSDAVYKHIEAKDAEGAAAAFKTMTQACGACHKVHKK
jgi:cytochrome c556